ncbi:pilus assembly protein TadG-related protein [Steroidobacter flavus]|uniref:Pilus assembly protein TadG-related protein n=1 Tax=Steroidobacter flavus TaxID=1842136 RepID=A0ABV8T2S4_9GAMM
MQSIKSRTAQRGAVAVLIAIAMGALILTAGLALDMGHVFLNKTRLQNVVDAAALAAARTLDDTGNTALATAEAQQAFGNNAAATGNRELSTAYGGGAGSLQVTIEYSTTLPPFAAGAPSGPYVRVRATGFTMPAWLVRIGGIFQKTVAATAVAGPRTLNVGSTVCNVAPMMVCGNAAAPNMWGYTLNAPVVLKKSTPGGQSPVGPGNFQLIQLGGSGAAVVRENMAGSYDACITGGSTIQTQTGNEAGPVAQGLNTRFGQYNGPMHGTESTYPPDVIVDAQNPALRAVQSGQTYNVYQGNTQVTAANINQLLYDYQDYLHDLMNPASYDYQPINEGGTGAFERRVLAVPVGNCTGTTNGQGSVPLLGFACFFLLQPAEQQGNDSFVYGQFISDCSVNGTPGPSPVAGNGPHIIQLYDDPNSSDS